MSMKRIEDIVYSEMENTISSNGYILETVFSNALHMKYGYSRSAIMLAMRRLYGRMALIKRRLSNDLKRVYKIDQSGCPIVYVPENDFDINETKSMN